MARRSHDDALGVVGAETVIGAGVVVQGNLESESDVMIDGQLTGNVAATGDITIGVNAKIKGNLKGNNITIAGQLTGDIHALGEASIRETGQVKGDVSAANLAITSGGIFVGRSVMNTTPKD
jgi:cytoskeletal protein CcmA (bactofilin family)